jgi:hypothetical protein
MWSGIAPLDVKCEPGCASGGERSESSRSEALRGTRVSDQGKPSETQGDPGLLLVPHPQPDSRRRKTVGSRRLAISMTCGRVF